MSVLISESTKVSDGFDSESLKQLSSEPIALSEAESLKLTEAIAGQDSLFHYPLWWTTFVCFLREGNNATESYRRARPELHITSDNYGVKAFNLLRDPFFRQWLKRIEDGSVSEIDKWKRDSFHRVKKLQRVLDKSTSDEMKPKDIQAIASSEKILHDMGNRVLGIKDDTAPIQVQVNMSNVIAGIHAKIASGEAGELSVESVAKFIESDAVVVADPAIEAEKVRRLAALKFPESAT